MKLKALTVLAVLVHGSLHAQTVAVSDAWVRASVPGQTATGVFMKITARQAVSLVGASTPSAGAAELHEMKMDGDVMTMRALAGALRVAAGETVELKPGGHHIMLTDLRTPLPKGAMVTLTLLFNDAKGLPGKVQIQVPVSTIAPTPAAAGQNGMAGHQH